VPFLAHILKLTPRESTLYQLIVLAIPETETAIGQIAQQIPTVIEGLKSAGARTSDQAIKDALTNSRGVLEDIQHGIPNLECYKRLHDCLHFIQIRPFAVLLSALRTVENSEQLNGLRAYQDQVQSQVESAQNAAHRLPDDGKSIEGEWIDKLAETVEIYSKALDKHNPAAAKAAVIKLSHELEQQSPRLNRAIVREAKGLPLNGLRTALDRVSASDPTRTPAIQNAIAALSRVENTLNSRVAEHGRWQNLDDHIWMLDDLFNLSADPTGDFIVLWPDAKASLRSLVDLNPHTDWSSTLLERAAQIDEELLRLDAVKTPASEGPVPKGALGNVFFEFRRQARMRFFHVDSNLLNECTQLGRIGEPVGQILQELRNG